MRRSLNRIFHSFILLLLFFALMTVGAFAEGETNTDPPADPPAAMSVVSTFDAEEGFLTVVCTQEDASGSFVLAVQDDWAEYGDKVQTLQLTGDVKVVSAGTFAALTQLKTVRIEASGLETVEAAAFPSGIGWLYYVGSEESSAETVGVIGASHTVYLEAGDLALLRKVTIADVEHGTVLTDAGPFAKEGSTIRFSVLPEAGYRYTKLNDRQIDGKAVYYLSTRYTVQGDTELTAACEPYKKLAGENTYGNCGTDVKWYLFEDGELYITGIGEIETKATASGYPWYPLRDRVKSLLVDNGVTSLPNYAFVACRNLEQAEFLGDLPVCGKSLFYTTQSSLFVIYYHEDFEETWTEESLNKMKDASGNEYDIFCVEQINEDYSRLTLGTDGYYRNTQGIIFTLDEFENTAAVGTNDTTQNNNSGYSPDYAGGNGAVFIPEEVRVYSDDGLTYQAYRVTFISKYAFAGNKELKTITIGANVRDVGTGAFYGCSGFTDFYVSKKSGSFLAWDGILFGSNMHTLFVVPGGKEFTSYEVPSSVTTINIGAFYQCVKIQEVVLNAGVYTICDDAFNGASGLRFLWINDSVIEIGDRAFYGCSSLQELYIRDSVQSIGARAFNNCSSLHTLYIYPGVQTIGDYPLTGCTSLVDLTLPFLGTSPTAGLRMRTLYEVNVANMKKMPLRYVTVAKGTLYEVKNGATFVFEGCSQLKSVTFGKAITSIPNACFRDCISLEYVALGTAGGDRGVVSIGRNVTKIGNIAFMNCPLIKRFDVNEGNWMYESDYWGALYTEYYKNLVCYPPASGLRYYCVKGEAESILPSAFYYCKNLISVNIPSSTTAAAGGFRPSPLLDAAPNNAYNIDSICVHENSQAFTDLGGATKGLKIFESKTFKPTRIDIQRISDQLAFETGTEPVYQNMYFVAAYPGVTILLDPLDYELTLSGTTAGSQTVTATYNMEDLSGNHPSVQFNILFFEKQDDMTIREYPMESSLASYEDLRSFAAFYGFDSKMLDVCDAGIIDNVAKVADLRYAIYVPAAVYKPAKLANGSAVGKLKVFFMDGTAPVSKPHEESWLPAPTDLTWGDPDNDRIGMISWKPSSDDTGFYRVCVYQKGAAADGSEDNLVTYTIGTTADKTGTRFILPNQYDSEDLDDYDRYFGYGWNTYSQNGTGMDCLDFVNLIRFESRPFAHGDGTYYFTVTAINPDGGNVRRSITVRSEDFEYKRPEIDLAPCTDLQWLTNGESLSWTPPENRNAVEGKDIFGGYTINMYFRRWIDGDWRYLDSLQVLFDNAVVSDSEFQNINDQLFSMNNYRAGYYAFTITAETSGIGSANRAAESAMCETPIYYSGSLEES